MGKSKRTSFDMDMIYKGLQELKTFCNSRDCWERDPKGKERKCPLATVCDQFTDVHPGLWGLNSLRHLAGKQKTKELEDECMVTTSCRECSQDASAPVQ